jgi:hypothetical protein
MQKYIEVLGRRCFFSSKTRIEPTDSKSTHPNHRSAEAESSHVVAQRRTRQQLAKLLPYHVLVRHFFPKRSNLINRQLEPNIPIKSSPPNNMWGPEHRGLMALLPLACAASLDSGGPTVFVLADDADE